MLEQIYTIKELANILKIDPETVRIKVKKGIIGSFKVGNQYRITEADLQEYIKANRSKNELSR